MQNASQPLLGTPVQLDSSRVVAGSTPLAATGIAAMLQGTQDLLDGYTTPRAALLVKGESLSGLSQVAVSRKRTASDSSDNSDSDGHQSDTNISQPQLVQNVQHPASAPTITVATSHHVDLNGDSRASSYQDGIVQSIPVHHDSATGKYL